MTPERVAELAKGKAIDGIGWDSFAADIAAESERELAAERERCCRAVCEECQEGRHLDMWGKYWRHVYLLESGMGVDSPCKADPIRRLSRTVDGEAGNG